MEMPGQKGQHTLTSGKVWRLNIRRAVLHRNKKKCPVTPELERGPLTLTLTRA